MQKSFHKGFTLVETLVAITILLLAIVGPMTIAAKGLQSAFFANDQTTAVFLAQEGLESIEALRDNSALDVINGSGPNTWQWYADLLTECKDGTGCDVDIAADNYHACNPQSDCQLYYDANATNGHFYSYDNTNGDASKFTRIIDIDEVTPDDEVRVTVTIQWESNLFSNSTREVVLQTSLFDWYDN